LKAQLTPGFSLSRGRVRAGVRIEASLIVRRCRVVCGFPVRSAPDRPMGRYCHEVTRVIVPGPRTTPACGAAPARSPRAVAMWDRRCPGADPLHLSRRRIATALNTVDRDKSLRPSAPATRGAAQTPACSVRRARSVRDVCDRGGGPAVRVLVASSYASRAAARAATCSSRQGRLSRAYQ
jgi:hypothetical protein